MYPLKCLSKWGCEVTLGYETAVESASLFLSQKQTSRQECKCTGFIWGGELREHWKGSEEAKVGREDGQ